MIHLHKKRYEYLEEINIGVLKQVPGNSAGGERSVLDVGCGSGALSGAIRKKGYVVWGVEQNGEAAETAVGRIDRMITGDLLAFDAIRSELGTRKFDTLIFADVLEHVYDPYSVLLTYLEFLKPGGRLIVSLPNALVWTNRLNFLLGRFEYADTGVMDRTHIRFFTFASAKRLVRAVGCSLERTDYRPFFVRAVLPLMKRLYWKKAEGRRKIIDSGPYRAYLKWVYPVEYVLGWWWKSLFAFQIILVGIKEEGVRNA